MTGWQLGLVAAVTVLGLGTGQRTEAQGAAAPITLSVDLTDAPRKLVHASEVMPVTGDGALTLVYPKWVPGEHGPTGPLVNMAGFEITANGQHVEWQRDPIDMYAFHLQVPAGAKQLEMKIDYLPVGNGEYSSGGSTSANLALLSWNTVVVYPQGAKASDVMVTPSVVLPMSWKYGTALEARSGVGGGIGTPGKPGESAMNWSFKTVSLETLVDSPVLAGRWFKEVPLAPGAGPKHFLDMAADGPEDLELSKEHLQAFSKLVEETGALYKSRHYGSYHFLVTLSDQVAHFGLEHHQSSDDRVNEKTFTDDNRFVVAGDLLPHEFTHSWNGKYRRPAGLATPDYQQPMVGDLLWVYEGLTQYLGDVLAARSGIWTAEQFRGYLADSAADMDALPGRRWRTLQDTARSVQTLNDAGGGWDNWRRGLDYYPEGELIWLDVDTTIREKTKGKRSLNDFVAAFHGLGGNTAPKVVPYTFDDVVAGLNAVVANDWAAFLRERLESHGPHAPLGGLQRGGYTLIYAENSNSFSKSVEALTESASFWYSIGLRVGKGGTVSDVLKDGPGDKAGLAPGMKIVAVNGRAFTPDLLKAALKDAKGQGPAISLIAENTGYFRMLTVDYHDGERYPFLERVDGTPDRLDDILKPMTK